VNASRQNVLSRWQLQGDFAFFRPTQVTVFPLLVRVLKDVLRPRARPLLALWRRCGARVMKANLSGFAVPSKTRIASLPDGITCGQISLPVAPATTARHAGDVLLPSCRHQACRAPWLLSNTLLVQKATINAGRSDQNR
jgi:hypothetical protein